LASQILASQIKAGYQMGLWLRSCIFIAEQSKHLLKSSTGSAAILYGLMAATVTGVAAAAPDTSIFESFGSLADCSSKPFTPNESVQNHLVEYLCNVYDEANEFYSQLGGDDGSILPDTIQKYIDSLKTEFFHIHGALLSLFEQIMDRLED
jgi:hypothetical protein